MPRPVAAFRGWSERRLGERVRRLTLPGHRIYILPTRFGVAFAGLTVAMLLGATNYGAGLAYGLTFLLGGLGLVALRVCRDNLLGLEVGALGAAPAFAGEPAIFRIEVSNTSRSPRYEIELAVEGARSGPLDIPAGDRAVFALPVRSVHRGRLALPRITVSTRHPASLFRAFAHARLDAHALIYPVLATPEHAAPRSHADGAGSESARPGDDDFAGLHAAAPNDPPRRIAWKAYARTGTLLRKSFTAEQSLVYRFDFDALTDTDVERRLSRLARACVDASAAGHAFSLRLPGSDGAVGHGDAHLAHSLERLALHAVGSEPA